jgi:mannose-6-phosphate isomerase-like protein (cupin superfamily)
MEAKKYSVNDVKKIDLDTKIIYKYPTPTKDFDLGHMVVKGRHPVDPDTFIVENDCSFVMYILSGYGKVYAGGQEFDVTAKDVVFVPAKNNFAVEGEFEYVTFDSPAFYPEQSSEIKID